MDVGKLSKIYRMMIETTISNNVYIIILSTIELLSLFYFAIDFSDWTTSGNDFIKKKLQYIMPDIIYTQVITENDYDYSLYLSVFLVVFNLIFSGLIYSCIKIVVEYSVLSKLLWTIYSNFQLLFLKTFNYYFFYIFLRNPFKMIINTQEILASWNKISDFGLSIIFFCVYFIMVLWYIKYVVNPFFFLEFKISIFQKVSDYIDIAVKISLILYYVSKQNSNLDNNLTKIIYLILMIKQLVYFFNNWVPVNNMIVDLYRSFIRLVCLLIYIIKNYNIMFKVKFNFIVLFCDGLIILCFSLLFLLIVRQKIKKIIHKGEGSEFLVMTVLNYLYCKDLSQNVNKVLVLNHISSCVDEKCDFDLLLKDNDTSEIDLCKILMHQVDHEIHECHSKHGKNLLYLMKLLLIYVMEPKNNYKLFFHFMKIYHSLDSVTIVQIKYLLKRACSKNREIQNFMIIQKNIDKIDNYFTEALEIKNTLLNIVNANKLMDINTQILDKIEKFGEKFRKIKSSIPEIIFSKYLNTNYGELIKYKISFLLKGIFNYDSLKFGIDREDIFDFQEELDNIYDVSDNFLTKFNRASDQWDIIKYPFLLCEELKYSPDDLKHKTINMFIPSVLHEYHNKQIDHEIFHKKEYNFNSKKLILDKHGYLRPIHMDIRLLSDFEKNIFFATKMTLIKEENVEYVFVDENFLMHNVSLGLKEIFGLSQEIIKICDSKLMLNKFLTLPDNLKNTIPKTKQKYNAEINYKKIFLFFTEILLKIDEENHSLQQSLSDLKEKPNESIEIEFLKTYQIAKYDNIQFYYIKLNFISRLKTAKTNDPTKNNIEREKLYYRIEMSSVLNQNQSVNSISTFKKGNKKSYGKKLGSKLKESGKSKESKYFTSIIIGFLIVFSIGFFLIIYVTIKSKMINNYYNIYSLSENIHSLMIYLGINTFNLFKYNRTLYFFKKNNTNPILDDFSGSVDSYNILLNNLISNSTVINDESFNYKLKGLNIALKKLSINSSVITNKQPYINTLQDVGLGFYLMKTNYYSNESLDNFIVKNNLLFNAMNQSTYTQLETTIYFCINNILYNIYPVSRDVNNYLYLNIVDKIAFFSDFCIIATLSLLGLKIILISFLFWGLTYFKKRFNSILELLGYNLSMNSINTQLKLTEIMGQTVKDNKKPSVIIKTLEIIILEDQFQREKEMEKDKGKNAKNDFNEKRALVQRNSIKNVNKKSSINPNRYNYESSLMTSNTNATQNISSPEKTKNPFFKSSWDGNRGSRFGTTKHKQNIKTKDRDEVHVIFPQQNDYFSYPLKILLLVSSIYVIFYLVSYYFYKKYFDTYISVVTVKETFNAYTNDIFLIYSTSYLSVFLNKTSNEEILNKYAFEVYEKQEYLNYIFPNFVDYDEIYSFNQGLKGKILCENLYNKYNEMLKTNTDYSNLIARCKSIDNGIMNSDINTIVTRIINNTRKLLISFNSLIDKSNDKLLEFILNPLFSITQELLEVYLNIYIKIIRDFYIPKISENITSKIGIFTIVFFIFNMIIQTINIFCIKYNIVNYIKEKVKNFTVLMKCFTF